MTIINYGRLALGAASLGMMRQSLADMRKRSASRIQFGVPIRSFPLIQEKLVKAEVNGFVTAAMTEFTAARLEREPTANLAVETSHCKLFGTTRAWDTLYDAFQVAGGAAYLATNPYEKRLRDFRVTTVFEGTTEIHSFYPALSAMRNLIKQMGQTRENMPSLFRSFLADLFRRVEWPLEFQNRTLRGASRLARANAKSIRRLLLSGLLVYGKKALERQFFLRRITILSLYLFGLLAVLAKLAPEEKDGTLSEDDLALLKFFLEEAREVNKDNRRFLDSRKERLCRPISEGLGR